MPLASRRQFLGFGGLGFLVACSGRVRGARDGGLAPTPAMHDGDPTPPTIPIPTTPTTCEPTAENIEGPFYKPGAPSRAVLVGPRDPGERLLVGGIVRSAACVPLANAVLDIWQADHRGGYDNDGFGMRGTLVTDAAGRWGLTTIVPGRYLNGRRYRPSHIHVKVRAANHAELTTQLYFAGDPYLDGDPFYAPSLVMAHRRQGDHRTARFDFTLA